MNCATALTATVHFDIDQSDLRPEDRAILDAKVPILQANPAVTIRIGGHTDERGSDEYNLALGQRRAAAAKAYLVAARHCRGAHSRRSATARSVRWRRERTKARGRRTAAPSSRSPRAARSFAGHETLPSFCARSLRSRATGCLASKSDIRLLQDELRATRAQVAAGDTSILRAEDARRSQIAQLSATIDRMNDSLRMLSVRLRGVSGEP